MKKLLVSLSTLFVLLFSGCGGGGSGDSGGEPSILITNPTAESTYYTVSSDVRLGGTVSNASFIHVKNTTTGFATEAYVNYNDGYGSWFADIPGLVPGNNYIVATADSDGTGSNTAKASITVIRPDRPLELILNGADKNSSSTFWHDMHSYNESHKIALFADGTGRATTGSVFYENSGESVDFNWTATAPDTIVIVDCPTCSFQKLSRITGSTDEEEFSAQIETVEGDSELAKHLFILDTGTL